MTSVARLSGRLIANSKGIFVSLPSLCATLLILSMAVLSQAAENTIHGDAIVIDTHSDFIYRSDVDGSSLADEVENAQTTLGKLQQGGVDAQFFSVWAPPQYEDYGFARKTLELIDLFYKRMEQYPEHIEIARTVDDIRRIERSGKIAALMGIEGGHMIENRLAVLRSYYRLGVRYMTLTWSNNTDWADSSGDKEVWGGLADFGREVVKEMNRLGMMVDISHVSDKTFWDVLEVTSAPVIASHSSARALNSQPRNMSDEMIVGLAKNGGVIQINFYAYFLDQEFADKVDAELENTKSEKQALATRYLDDPIHYEQAEWGFYRRVESRVEWPPLSVLVDHIDHVVQLVGPEHAGIGSDFDGVTSLPQGMEHQGKLPNLTEALVAKGYSEQDIKLILGGNLLRVMAAVEAAASNQ